MGAALTWLGPSGCRAVAESILQQIDTRRSSGVEIWAACPWHEESSVGGAFSYNPDKDSACCLSCGEGGDIIAVWGALQGLDDAAAFREFRERFAPGATLDIPHRAPERPAWSPVAADPSPDLWQERASEFCAHSVERLQGNASALTQLEAWGITPDVAKICQIGWNDADKSVPREAWGLPELIQAGKVKKVWLPMGLTFPMIQHGRVVKIKIRRDNESIKKSGFDLRYWEVPGSTKIFHRYGRQDARVWAIVETERDAAMIWSRVRDLGIGCMSTGGASKRPDADSAAMLSRAELVLNALDNDHAGAQATARFWEREFPQAKRWPTPPSAGKDAGEAVGSLDIREWITAGLPSHVLRSLERAKKPPRTAPPAPELAPQSKAAQYLDWYMGIARELVRLTKGAPIAIDERTGMAVAPHTWSMQRENWDRLRKIDDLMRQVPAIDLFTEAWRSGNVPASALEQALPVLARKMSKNLDE